MTIVSLKLVAFPQRRPGSPDFFGDGNRDLDRSDRRKSSDDEKSFRSADDLADDLAGIDIQLLEDEADAYEFAPQKNPSSQLAEIAEKNKGKIMDGFDDMVAKIVAENQGESDQYVALGSGNFACRLALLRSWQADDISYSGKLMEERNIAGADDVVSELIKRHGFSSAEILPLTSGDPSIDQDVNDWINDLSPSRYYQIQSNTGMQMHVFVAGKLAGEGGFGEVRKARVFVEENGRLIGKTMAVKLQYHHLTDRNLRTLHGKYPALDDVQYVEKNAADVGRIYQFETTLKQLQIQYETKIHQEVSPLEGLVKPDVTVAFDGGMLQVMPFSSQSFRDMLEEVGALSIPTATTMIMVTLQALERLHQAGFMHRDLTPDNLLLSMDRVGLSDFGYVDHLPPDGELTIGLPLGTLPYLCSKLHGNEPMSRKDWMKADVFQLMSTFAESVFALTPIANTLVNLEIDVNRNTLLQHQEIFQARGQSSYYSGDDLTAIAGLQETAVDAGALAEGFVGFINQACAFDVSNGLTCDAVFRHDFVFRAQAEHLSERPSLSVDTSLAVPDAFADFMELVAGDANQSSNLGGDGQSADRLSSVPLRFSAEKIKGNLDGFIGLLAMHPDFSKSLWGPLYRATTADWQFPSS